MHTLIVGAIFLGLSIAQVFGVWDYSRAMGVTMLAIGIIVWRHFEQERSRGRQ